MANLSAPVVSRIAEQITRITSFESNDAAGQLLEVLEKQPLVTNATLWKIKRSSHTLCAKGRTTEIFNPDPLDARFLNEFVCRYDESFLAKVIESDEFHNYQPYVIEDVNDHKADVFFAGLIAHASRPLRKAIILPLKSHIQKELTEPGYFMVIYINEGQEGVDIHESLLRAIANKTSSTLSSQIEIGLNEITTFMKDTAIRHGGIRNILTASIKELIPKYFSYSHSLLIWRPSASARYECIYSTPDGITLTAAQTDAIAHMCVDRYEATAIVFDTTIFARILPQFGRYKSLIVAPIQNHTAGDKPHGFVILCDKLSPLARRINPEAAIVDRFDWEDELLMNHTISMISMVSELLYADDRRKQLADQLAHEMVMPANYIIGTCDEFIDYFENALDLPLHRQQKHIHTSAQEHVKEIGTITDTIERQGRGFLKYIEESGTLIAEFLASVGKEQAKDFAEQAHLLRQRHAFTGGVDDKQKMDAARELVLLGDKVDWAAVEPFLVSSRHPDARELLQHIRKRRDAGDSA